MEREIKFRVLYKSQKQKFSFVGYERITNGRWEWMCPELNPDKGERWSNGVYPALSRHTYMRNQFTELKDKNGKEIYEGDILMHPSIKTSNKQYTITVEWDDYVRGPINDRDCTMDYCYGWVFDEDPCDMIVIGNKYENPELLNTK